MKIFAAVLVLSLIFGAANVEAAEFQELRGKIILPDRIRHRNDSHKLTKPAPPRIEVPRRKNEDRSEIRYTQRQPKKPPRLDHPKFPIASSDHRGSETRRRFGPPRFRR